MKKKIKKELTRIKKKMIDILKLISLILELTTEENIRLTNGKIRRIEEDGLSVLTNFKLLYLFNNELDKIEVEVFFELGNLVDLDRKKITRIEKESWSSLKSLKGILLLVLHWTK